MSTARATSPSSGRVYGVVRVCRAWRLARSTFYSWREEKAEALKPPPLKRGPKTELSDEDLLDHVLEILARVEGGLGFSGEGYRKAWARLRHAGVRVSAGRVLRIMRVNGLLAPQRVGRPQGPKAHDGTIVVEQPDTMWGTDLTTVSTRLEGTAAVFFAVDHATTEIVGIHASKNATRFEALEPIRQGVGQRFGSLDTGVACGLKVRHDHGSQYTSAVFQSELQFLGIESSPSYVRQPEGNGCAERTARLLKEQLLWLTTFDTVEELRQALLAFQERYNRSWIVGRHGYLTPSEARAQALEKSRAA